jgi:hypothetical protein
MLSVVKLNVVMLSVEATSHFAKNFSAIIFNLGWAGELDVQREETLKLFGPTFQL